MQWRRGNINHEHYNLKLSQKYTHKAHAKHNMHEYEATNELTKFNGYLLLKHAKFMSLFNHQCCAFWTHIATMNSHSHS